MLPLLLSLSAASADTLVVDFTHRLGSESIATRCKIPQPVVGETLWLPLLSDRFFYLHTETVEPGRVGVRLQAGTNVMSSAGTNQISFHGVEHTLSCEAGASCIYGQESDDLGSFGFVLQLLDGTSALSPPTEEVGRVRWCRMLSAGPQR